MTNRIYCRSGVYKFCTSEISCPVLTILVMSSHRIFDKTESTERLFNLTSDISCPSLRFLWCLLIEYLIKLNQLKGYLTLRQNKLPVLTILMVSSNRIFDKTESTERLFNLTSDISCPSLRYLWRLLIEYFIKLNQLKVYLTERIVEPSTG